jgi:hypothetical protein
MQMSERRRDIGGVRRDILTGQDMLNVYVEWVKASDRIGI